MTSPATGLLDLSTLEELLRGALPGADASPFSVDLLSGGLSNLTFRIRQADRSWVLRRPPLGHVLATAHDMRREYRFLSGLEHSPVPTPVPHLFVDDSSLIGAPFYLMEYVDGQIIRGRGESLTLRPAQRAQVTDGLVTTLTRLHSIDPAGAGLSDIGRADGFFGRQVNRWWKQWEQSATRELPDVARLHRSLAQAEPANQRGGIVHGDYRLDNAVLDQSGGVVAVLDWEMATLGDPLTDLATLCVYWQDPDDARRPLVQVAEGVTSLTGFGTRREVVEAYARLTGADVTGFARYVGLAAFKLAVILEGIHKRHLLRETVGDGFDVIADSVAPAAAIGLAAVAGDWEHAF